MELIIFTALLFSSFMNTFGVPRYNKAACLAEAAKPWSYDDYLPNGVGSWEKLYPGCRGRSQSPINIVTKKIKKNKNFPKLQLTNYDKPVTHSTILNDGYTVQITPRDGIRRSVQVHGVTYNLNEVHFHWGVKKNIGSEHTVDNKQYSMEIHFVHTDRRDQTAVIAAFYQESKKSNKALKPIIDVLPKIPYEGNDVEIRDKLYLDSLLDTGCSYFQYNGSLTTPECTENVMWMVCHDVRTIGYYQLEEFRKLYSVRRTKEDMSNCKISNNFRPTQPLNGRIVFSSN